MSRNKLLKRLNIIKTEITLAWAKLIWFFTVTMNPNGSTGDMFEKFDSINFHDLQHHDCDKDAEYIRWKSSIKYAYNYNSSNNDILVIEYVNQDSGDPYFSWEGDLFDQIIEQ